ncbi:hypothetical protein ONE63_001731 [Megalurothrips usitatus]|uniref:CRAL-TRIO domain-containing protein n=1 Tax=Megalurothrips usitatus TaxID=439358 RepID=A0AAV7XDE6_9NEOP|nr:hypothetical protein ONE63_001731 [Megalurothrips usitatus]
MDLVAAGLDELTAAQEAKMYEEYGADPEALRADAETLREWAEKQPHLPSLTDKEDPWLARYILACKNSLERAKRRLDYFFCVQSRWPEYFRAPTVEEGVAFAEYCWGGPTPVLMPDGTRLTFYKFTPALAAAPANMNWMMFYMLSLGYVQLQLTTPGQPLRIEVVFDVENYVLGINTSFVAHLAEFRRFVKCLQVALPLHVRRIHVVNAPSLAVTALDKLVRPFLQDKLNKRIITHDSLETLAKTIPHFCLPKDLGGSMDMTMKEITLKWANIAEDCEKWYDTRKWMRANLDLKPEKDFNDLDGTFRKLTVD